MSWSGDLNDSEEELEQNIIEPYIDSFEVLVEAEDILSRLQDYIFYHGLDMLNKSDVKLNMMDLLITLR